MFHGHLDYFQTPPLGGRPNTKPRDHGISNAHNCWFILFCQVWGSAWIDIHWNSIWSRAWSHMIHTALEVPWPHCMVLEMCWEGLWTIAFGLSKFHGHSSWLVCEVALIITSFDHVNHGEKIATCRCTWSNMWGVGYNEDESNWKEIAYTHRSKHSNLLLELFSIALVTCGKGKLHYCHDVNPLCCLLFFFSFYQILMAWKRGIDKWQ